MDGRLKYEGNWKIGSRAWDGRASLNSKHWGHSLTDIVEGIVRMKKREMENEGA